MAPPKAIIVMGVSGSGKSTLGAALAQATGASFLEGDTFHPPQNVAAMAAGRPLDDAMRAPWLTTLGQAAAREMAAGRGVVVTCSALKRAYRDRLRALTGGCLFLFLDVPKATLADRMARRQGHYMPASLLDSQLAALERPDADEADCLALDGAKSAATLLATALDAASA